MLAFAIMAFGFVGVTTHFAPMLRDAGLSAVKAGQLVGLIGLSTLLSRIIVGRLLDKVHPPRVAACACGICASGCLLLTLSDMRMASVAAIALGGTMGAETDLVAFLTARYFGLASYGRAYACQFAAFVLAAGLSGIWVGIIADRTGGYGVALLISAALLLIAGGLFWQLPRETPVTI
jgi:nitrate/nitrite transporter NarK